MALAAARPLTEGSHFRSEIEAQGVKHLEGPLQLNAVFFLRWLAADWSSLAIGSGLSYATAIPRSERVTTTDATSHLLHAFMLELEAGPKAAKAFLRLHHRSGVFGLFNDVWGGSDYLCAGLRLDY